MTNIVTGIDVGTHQVKVVIAERSDDPRQPPRVLGTGYAESRGMKQGYVVSVPDVSRSIAAAVAQASKAAQVKVKRAYIALGGVGLDEAFSRGEAVVERGNSEVTDRDIPRAISASEKALSPSIMLNRRIIDTIPLRYSIDGVRVLGKSPVGMKGARISVETLFITCLEKHVTDLFAAVDEAGIEVEDIVVAPMAASFVALSKMQKRVGCVLVNIGAETTSVVVFEDTVPLSVKTFPVGSSDITNDIALGLRVPPEEAEQLKAGAVLGSQFPKKKIDDIVNKRLTEILKLVEAHLQKIGKDELLPAGIIVTGGGASLASVPDLAKAIMRLPARAATLTESPAIKSQLKDGSWAVAYGLTVWGLSGAGEGGDYTETSTLSDLLSRAWRWFQKFLP